MPDPLPTVTPPLTARTFNEVANARAELAALDANARQLPNPALLRRPALQREAQSTSALEGTYTPLEAVLGANEDEEQPDRNLHDVLNYVRVAETGFTWLREGRALTVGLLAELQRRLVAGTPADNGQAGRVRDIQVMIGAHTGGRIQDARFVPPPGGAELDRQLRDLLDWVAGQHDREVDPVVAAGMVHYQFETLHPFNDGNGRLGRLLVVLHLMSTGILAEPTLTVSPWFEARRAEYFDRLLAVSTGGNWDAWIRFFATGIAASARDTATRLRDLLAVQVRLKGAVRAAGIRAETAMRLIDFAIGQPIFTVRQVGRHLAVSYARANGLVGQLVAVGVLRQYGDAAYDRRFAAPEVLAILLR